MNSIIFIMISKNMTDGSKKVKVGKLNKQKLWNEFDAEINGDVTPLECIYRECGDRESCERCNYSLAFSDEGFLTCTNIQLL